MTTTSGADSDSEVGISSSRGVALNNLVSVLKYIPSFIHKEWENPGNHRDANFVGTGGTGNNRSH